MDANLQNGIHLHPILVIDNSNISLKFLTKCSSKSILHYNLDWKFTIVSKNIFLEKL